MQNLVYINESNRIILMKSLILILLAILPLISCAQAPQEISVQQLHEINIDNKEHFLLDVRTINEYGFSRIKNSLNIDVLESKAFLEKVNKLDKSKNYYIICRSGNRSMKAIKKMEELGFENLYNITGGMLEWEKQQLPVEK